MVVWNGDIHGTNRGLLAVEADTPRPAPPIFEVVTSKADRKALRVLMADGQARTVAHISAALNWPPVKAYWLVRKAYSRGYLKHQGKGWYRQGRTPAPALPFTSEELAS